MQTVPEIVDEATDMLEALGFYQTGPAAWEENGQSFESRYIVHLNSIGKNLYNFKVYRGEQLVYTAPTFNQLRSYFLEA